MLKNYRCFADTHAATLDIGPGFTALVGPNDSGKSSFLKFFLELRILFQNLSPSSGTLEQLTSGGGVNIGGASQIEDAFEIFHNGNNRPMTVDIALTPQTGQLIQLSLEGSRKSPGTWKALEFLGGADKAQLVPVGVGYTQLQWATGGRADIKYDLLKETCGCLANSIYVGPFRNAISEGGGNHYDLTIGTSFIQVWDVWKTGNTRAQNEVIQAVEEDIAHVFGFKRLEINATPDKKAFQVIIDRKPYRLRELGAGLAQFIIVFGNVAIRQPDFLLIDEPELNLHPSLQADFLTSLASYTKQGVIFATHSIGLARSIGDRIFTFKKDGNHSIVRAFDQTPNFAEFLGEMSFSSFKELGFESVLLVEGVTEVKAIQQFLRALGKDHQIIVLPLGGAQMIRVGVQQELSELRRITPNVAVLIDSERKQQGEPLGKQRAGFVKECQELGFRVHTTQRRAFENYLTENALKAVKGQNFKALEAYQDLKAAAAGWAKSDNWRIARSMTKEEILATDVGQFLDGLK